MTRLETNGEPSMEEILASIRRIIAEEPPGSRASAPPPRAAQQTTASGSAAAAASIDRSLFGRDTAPAKADPHIRADAFSAAQAGSNHSNLSTGSFPAPADSKSDRRDAAPREAFAPSRSSAPADSVQAQLSELLDDDDAGVVAARPEQVDTGSQSNIKRSSESQPRFTVSRDGYVPPAASVNDAADPFDFDLGPSPFSKRETDPPSTRAKAPPSENAFDDALSGLDAGKPAINARPASPQVAEPSPVFSARYAEPAKSEPARPAATAFDVAGRQPADERTAPQKSGFEAQPAAKPAPAVEPKTGAPVASPSIAATLPPAFEVAAASNANSAAFAKTVEAMSRRSGQDSIQDVVTEAVSAAMSRPSKYSAVEIGDRPVAVEVDDALTPGQQIAVRDASSNSGGGNLPAVRDGETGIRTMEDTVADLLRPMLKSWLAENMPKIIERALRREISEMTMSAGQQHKTAAE